MIFIKSKLVGALEVDDGDMNSQTSLFEFFTDLEKPVSEHLDGITALGGELLGVDDESLSWFIFEHAEVEFALGHI